MSKIIRQKKLSLFQEIISLPRESWVGFLSSFSEAYNIALLPFMAPVLSSLMFPHVAGRESIFFSYCLIFLGSLCAYPLGALYYGKMGDYKGRLKACMSSSFGLALSTGIMALLPVELCGGYVWVLFLLCACTQFFFSAGEYYSSVVFSLEHRPHVNQGLLSGLSCFFAVQGLLLANGVSTLISGAQFPGAWRLPFVIGLLTGLISFGFKYYCKESPLFENLKEELGNYSLKFFKRNFVTILSITAIVGLFSVFYSYVFIFFPLVSPKSSAAYVEWETFICLIVYAGVLFFSGYLSDKFGIKKTMVLGLFLGGLTFLMAGMTLPGVSFFMIKIFCTIGVSIYIGPIHAWILQQTDPQSRCRVISLSIALAAMFFSNSTVPVCLFVYEKSQSLLVTGFYLLPFTAIVLYFLVNSKREN
jgi:MHS family proline/betaine transporter-like MFS transporter